MLSCRQCRSQRGESCRPCHTSSEALSGAAHQMAWWGHCPFLSRVEGQLIEERYYVQYLSLLGQCHHASPIPFQIARRPEMLS